MQRVHPQQEQSQQNRKHSAMQCKIKFRLVQYIYKLFMFCLAMNIIFSIFVISQNNNYGQIIYFGCFEIIFMVIFIICLLYQYCQFNEVENNYRLINQNTQHEIDANLNQYSSTFQFVIAFTNQSKYLWIKFILLYCSLFLLMLTIQIHKSQVSICLCYDSIKDQYNEFNYSELKCLLEKDCGIQEYESITFPYLNKIVLINWSIFATLMVYQFANILIMPFGICFRQFIIKEYKYTQHDIQKQATKSFGSFQCGSIMLYSLSKLIILSILMILTQNESCYVLVSSNLFYYLSIMVVFHQIKYTINYEQAIDDLCYKNSQMLIDSILWMKRFSYGFFRLLLILCLIFTTVGQINYKRYQKYTNIINYDVYIEFDCGIFQFINLIYLIYKYIIYSNCKKKKLLIFDEQYHRSIQELSTNQSSLQNQSILVNSRMQTDPQNVTIINQTVINHDLDDMECGICLQLINQGQFNIVQLKCQHTFHLPCLQQWFYHQKLCPICRAEFNLS